MQATDQLRIGLVGGGAFGQEHSRALSQISIGKLEIVYDRNPERAQRIARAHDARTAPSIDDVWQDEAIDAVILATPSDTHYPLTLAAARSRKHVLVEKPVALSLDNVDEMERACHAAGVILFPGQTLRFHPVAKAFHDSREAGDIGDPVYFNWVSNANRKWSKGWRGWQTEAERTGGMTAHLGIHSIDLALWLLASRPQRVYAQGANTESPGLTFPNFLQVTIRCENGAHALLEVQTRLPGQGNRYLAGRLMGTRGQADWSLNEDGVFMSDAGTELLFAGYGESLQKELVHFIDCCRGTSEPLVTVEQSRDALHAALAANLSLQTGDAVGVSEIA